MLEVRDLHAGYGDVPVLFGVSLEVRAGEIVSIVGANGAGKTTTLRAISGILDRRGGEIRFEGESVTGLKPFEIVRRGIAHVPEGRQLFSVMTVEENLEMGANQLVGRAELRSRMAEVFELFPRLAERREQRANTLSGGEQQMLTIGRGLMLRPKLLILDEPSLGLAPKLVTTILETITRINKSGVSVLLVEQNLRQSLRHSHRGYVMENGTMVLDGAADALLEDARTSKAVLGLGEDDEGEEKSHGS
jgi:branched-chain amino acid transport system ATP-binding protein